MRILLVDDHAVVRRGLCQILADELGDVVCGEAASVPEAIEQIHRQNWDLVITDITLPGPSGLDLLKAMRSLRPRLPVLVLSVHGEDQFAIRVIRAGAAGYLNKDSAPQELVGAVRRVLDGGQYVSRTLAEKLASILQTATEQAPHEKLSDREFEVFRLLAHGHTVKEIALALNLSVKTVSTYRARTLAKMGLHHNADLTRYAVQHGLFELPAL